MLSKKQQEIIENSIWVVNTALKRQGLQADEDLRQSAILYMCKCLERFDTNQDIKWTTYAYKSVFLFIKRTHGKEVKKKSAIIDDDIFSLVEPIIPPLEEPKCFDESKYMLDRLKAVCSPEESQIIELKRQGYRAVEISTIMKCSSSKVNACMQSIKDKAREMEI